MLLLGWLILKQLSCILKQIITSKLMMTFICALVSEIMKICIMHSVTLINVLWHYKFIFFQLLQIALQLFLPRNVAIRWLTLVVWRKDMWSLTLKWSGIWVLLIKTVIFQISYIFFLHFLNYFISLFIILKISGMKNQGTLLEMNTSCMLMVLYMFCLQMWWLH